MKLLFDQNLSFRLVGLLEDLYPESRHVGSIGLDSASDITIFEYAGSHGFAIVTLDRDFAALSTLRGTLPHIVWMRCGNQPTRVAERLLRLHAPVIDSLTALDSPVCLEIHIPTL